LRKKKVNIIFQPCGKRGQVERGKTILEAAQELGIAIESICGGKHTCGKCKVRVEKGRLSPWRPEESKFIREEEQKQGYRLACLTKLSGDTLISIPDETGRHQQVIRKEAGEISVELNPAIKAYYVELLPPSLLEPLGDFERLSRALANSYRLKNLKIDYPTLQNLPQRLRSAGWKVTVFVWMDREIIDLQPGRVEDFYGGALDIGTTTVAIYLCNLKNGQVVATGSMMNPQVPYGEDVMSRISYLMMNPEVGLQLMQGRIIEGLNSLIQSTVESVQLSPLDILEMTVVGNTAMHHIFLGIDPQPLGLSPFSPSIHRSLDIKARDLGLKVHPAANVHVLPIEAGFVGADNVGVLIAEAPYQKEEMSLVIDIGTNGELILGNKQRLLSCSCATGPAFEGAHLRFGMRAAPGAIERVRLSSTHWEVNYKVIGQEKWKDECMAEEIQARGICGSGIIEAVAEMLKAGVLEKNGRINGNLSSPRLRKNENGYEFVIAWAKETATGQDITISTSDVRAVQLGKGALYSGAKIMMKTLGVERLDKVILAGGFGSYVDPERAMVLGMFPDCDLKNVFSVGNAAGDGARMALLNREKRLEAERMARQVEYIELTTYPDFTEEFINAMSIPHMRDDFPHLQDILKSRGFPPK